MNFFFSKLTMIFFFVIPVVIGSSAVPIFQFCSVCPWIFPFCSVCCNECFRRPLGITFPPPRSEMGIRENVAVIPCPLYHKWNITPTPRPGLPIRRNRVNTAVSENVFAKARWNFSGQLSTKPCAHYHMRDGDPFELATVGFVLNTLKIFILMECVIRSAELMNVSFIRK